MGPEEIAFIKQTLGLDSRGLAKAMNVALFTVARWERGESTPTGLQEEVLRALHQTAQKVAAEKSANEAKVVGGLVALGVGALIFAALTADSKPKRRKRKRYA